MTDPTDSDIATVIADDLSNETVVNPDEPAEYQRLATSAVGALRRAGYDVVLRTPDTPATPILRHGVFVRQHRGIWESYIDGNYIADHATEAEAWSALGCDPAPDTPTDSDTAARARTLLDAYPEDVFRPPRQGWKAGSVTGTAPNPDDEDGYDDVWITSEAFAAHVMRTIALPVITDLLAEVDAT